MKADIAHFDSKDSLELYLFKEVTVPFTSISEAMVNRLRVLFLGERYYSGPKLYEIKELYEDKIICSDRNEYIVFPCHVLRTKYAAGDMIFVQGESVYLISTEVLDSEFIGNCLKELSKGVKSEDREEFHISLDGFNSGEVITKDKILELLKLEVNRKEERLAEKKRLAQEEIDRRRKRQATEFVENQDKKKFDNFEIKDNKIILADNIGTLEIFGKDLKKTYGYDVMEYLDDKVYSALHPDRYRRYNYLQPAPGRVIELFESKFIEDSINFKFSKDKEVIHDVEFFTEKKKKSGEEVQKVKLNGISVRLVKLPFLLRKLDVKMDTTKIKLLKKLSGVKLDLIKKETITFNGPSDEVDLRIDITPETKYEFTVKFMDTSKKFNWNELKPIFFDDNDLKGDFNSNQMIEFCKTMGIEKQQMFDYIKKAVMLKKLSEAGEKKDD